MDKRRESCGYSVVSEMRCVVGAQRKSHWTESKFRNISWFMSWRPRNEVALP